MISCIQPFNHEIPGEKIITDNKSIDWVVDEIASRTGLVLTQDRRSPLVKWKDRIFTLIRHIR